MAHMLAVCDMEYGMPVTNGITVNYVFIFQAGKFGLYLFGGTPSELSALNALSTVRGLVAMTNGTVKWAELNNTISTAHRNKMNTWLSNNGYPTIPAGWTYRQVVRAIIRRMRNFGDDTDSFADSILNGTWVIDTVEEPVQSLKIEQVEIPAEIVTEPVKDNIFIKIYKFIKKIASWCAGEDW